MKNAIHSKFSIKTVKCSTCGTEMKIGTVANEMKVDTCSTCHPFYTGTQTHAQAAGQVDKFNKKYNLD